MKNIRMILMTLLAVSAVFLLSACSPDIEEETEEETLLTPEPIPEPDWADGIVTITVGRFETKQELLNEMEQQGIYAGSGTRDNIFHEDFSITNPEDQYTIEVAVVTMREAELETASTIETVTNQFESIGLRPMTTEETVELWLQLTEQPTTETGHRMSAFLVLLDQEEALSMWGTHYIYCIAHIKTKRRVETFRSIFSRTCHKDGSQLFFPGSQDPLNLNIGISKPILGKTEGTPFAAVITDNYQR